MMTDDIGTRERMHMSDELKSRPYDLCIRIMKPDGGYEYTQVLTALEYTALMQEKYPERNITLPSVKKYCAGVKHNSETMPESKITGAFKVGHDWLIPYNAKYPDSIHKWTKSRAALLQEGQMDSAAAVTLANDVKMSFSLMRRSFIINGKNEMPLRRFLALQKASWVSADVVGELIDKASSLSEKLLPAYMEDRPETCGVDCLPLGNFLAGGRYAAYSSGVIRSTENLTLKERMSLYHVYAFQQAELDQLNELAEKLDIQPISLKQLNDAASETFFRYIGASADKQKGK